MLNVILQENAVHEGASLCVAEATPELVQQLGFEKVQGEFLDEYKSNAILYKHKKTGAEVMSVTNEDENKVFGIVSRPPP